MPKTLTDVIKEQVKDREKLQVCVMVGQSFYTGPSEFAPPRYTVQHGHAKYLRDVRKIALVAIRHGIGVYGQISFITNACNPIEILLDGYMARHEAFNGPNIWSSRPLAFLYALCAMFPNKVTMFVGKDSLLRYCFDGAGVLVESITVDDGGC